MFEEKATLVSPDRPPIYHKVVCSLPYSLKEPTCSFVSPFPLRSCMFCGKGHPCPTLLNPPATAGQQRRIRTAAEKRLHLELSRGWFDLPPQQLTCVELKYLTTCFLLSTWDLCTMKLKTQRQDSPDSKEHAEEMMLLHRADIGHKSAENMQD